MEGAVDSGEGKSRKDILKALGAAAAGAVAGGVLSAKEVEASHGTLNAVSNSLAPAIHAENTGGGPGLEVTSGDGMGVVVAGNSGMLISAGQGTAVEAFSDEGAAMVARAVETHAIFGSSTQYAGVHGSGESGVVGIATEEIGTFGDGVLGSSPNGNGVRGTSRAAGIGVKAEAESDAGTALQVDGRAKFSSAAAGSIAAGQDSAFVSNLTVTSLSHVTVTLTGDPGQASSAPGSKPVVVWVGRQPGTGFVIHMSRPVRTATPFTYLIIEPV
jgi:hypothetical protein